MPMPMSRMPPSTVALSASFMPGNADHKGHCRDDRRTEQRRRQIIVRDGEAYRQRVDRRGNALHDQPLCGDCLCFGFLAAAHAFDHHFAADESEQDQRDPRNQPGKRGEIGHDRVDAHPADHRHERLKAGKCAGDETSPPAVHMRLMQTVCNGDSERVHCQTDAQ